jgi:hypothetical protein
MFLSDKHSPMSDLREAMTETLSKVARLCCNSPRQFLAKLNAGDVIAQEFKYHPACLVALYNRERERERQEDESNTNDASIAQLVSYILNSSMLVWALATFLYS